MAKISVVADQQILSDFEAEHIVRKRLTSDEAKNLVSNVEILSTQTGVLGLQYVVFTAIVHVEYSILQGPYPFEAAKNEVRAILNRLLGDTDVDVRFVGDPR